MPTFVDRGGTFTDVVHRDGAGRVVVRKVPSDRAVVGDLTDDALVFGTTVATNAVLEGTGVPTALWISEGFEDLPWIRHGARPSLFDPDARWPAPLCREVRGIPGRLEADGLEIAPLVLPEDADLDGVEALAICLVHAGLHPSHEATLAAWARARWPHLHVVASHEVCPEVGLLARCETALVDAAVTPVLHAAMVRDHIPAGARAMRSDGTLVDAPALRAPDAVLSGPAGGVLAVAAVAEQLGLAGAVGLDMGGTSTDVCVVEHGRLPRRHGDVHVGGVHLRRDLLEVETIAAGGGSIVAHDGVQVRVGPRSAGADPGPQCYGRGGPPTVTDAAVALGLLDPAAFTPPLDVDAIDLPAPAEACVRVAREAMAGAIRRIAAARGVDVRPFALVAYGGAAGQHAAGVAAELGIRRVVVHPCASVLSAWGQMLAAEADVASVAVWAPLDDAEALADAVRRAVAQLPSEGVLTIEVDLRAEGTDHALPLPHDPDPDRLRVAWDAAHAEVFGFRRPGARLEVVDVRARRTGPVAAPPPADGAVWGLEGAVDGPVRLDVPTTSVWVPEGWRARIERGLLVLDDVGAPAAPVATRRTPAGLAIWSSRFTAVAELAGEHLARLARSVNIRERRDFSCAVFGPDGDLVVNAPHIPVHLGAMGATVRDLIAHEPDAPAGSAWLTNDPAAGGSHLPDLTVITPVDLGGERAFVACRAHHVDVGGLTPGSMPPRSTTLADEGLVFRRVRIDAGEGLADLAGLVAGSRAPDELRADLEAQVAANRQAARALVDLGPADVVAAWMAHVVDAGAEAIGAHLDRLRAGTAVGVVGGVLVRVTLAPTREHLVVDFAGTEGPHPGNLNAPEAVVRAAVLYALRVAVGDDLPLNDGVLRCVDLRLPHPSLVSPPPGAAVVGGNVETSQHLVDLLLAALGVRAGSQGTMNNLTFGTRAGPHYETLGGGQGASAAGPGASCAQVHMTNTRLTDPEVLELRRPLRVWRHARRHGSGGAGQHPGGDGVVREIEVLAPSQVALLATSRDHGGAGAQGGEDGAPGEDQLCRDGTWRAWDGEPTSLAPGDRVRIATPGGGGWGASSCADRAASQDEGSDG